MKQLSIIIPVHNEEKIIKKELTAIIIQANKELKDISYEILVVENGSQDRTLQILHDFKEQYPEVRVISLPLPGYGGALREGLKSNKANYVVVFNIDLWDVKFIKTALKLCLDNKYDIVVGSKMMAGAKDLRPFVRKSITRFFNLFLRLVFDFRGTDTHGLKLLRQESILPIVELCKTNQEIFDTELILRAERAGLKIVEVPISCEEKRRSTYSILKRIPRTFNDLFLLFFSLR